MKNEAVQRTILMVFIWTQSALISLLIVASVLNTHLYYNREIISDGFTIKFVNQSQIKKATNLNATGYTMGHNDIFILNGLTKEQSLGVCWHEKMHNTLCRQEEGEGKKCDVDYEHKVIYSQKPNLFDRTCLFIWWIL